MDKIYGLTVSPMICISYCLERSSRMQCKERNPHRDHKLCNCRDVPDGPGSHVFSGQSTRENRVDEDNPGDMQTVQYSAEDRLARMCELILKVMGKKKKHSKALEITVPGWYQISPTKLGEPEDSQSIL